LEIKVARIFISHSRQDEDSISLFLRAFQASGVNGVYREFENPVPIGVIAEIIGQDIEFSSAVFVLLSETVETLPFTRDWVLYECGAAGVKKKPVWVFEPYESFGEITVTIPRFEHYVRFKTDKVNRETWRKYIQTIAASYNDNPLFAKAGLTILGGMVGGVWVALGGLLLGSILAPSVERPAGYATSCPNCRRQFVVHLPNSWDAFRCPACPFQELYLPQYFPYRP
jgi:hypothetical protein